MALASKMPNGDVASGPVLAISRHVEPFPTDSRQQPADQRRIFGSDEVDCPSRNNL
jgi:hypothetical protein